ncbi:MAG: flagellar hook-basal body complex protein FliE [Clostridiales bacterium]|nr:flagellar hook-basal body complex protein FliE [Clostridiales bacterium]
MNSFFTPIQPIQPMTFSEEKTERSRESGSAIPFSDMLKEAINEYETLQKTADDDTNALVLGDVNNIAQIQIDSMKASAALQTAVQLTSRAVNAYKEIMQMQV